MASLQQVMDDFMLFTSNSNLAVSISQQRSWSEYSQFDHRCCTTMRPLQLSCNTEWPCSVRASGFDELDLNVPVSTLERGMFVTSLAAEAVLPAFIKSQEDSCF